MKGTKKLSDWQPQERPDPEMCAIVRRIVVQVVFAYWNEHEKPIPLSPSKVCSDYIAQKVQAIIRQLREAGKWKKKWGYIGKRTIDRRVNEAADPRFYDGHEPKIVAVTAGVYQPNPKLFMEVKA